MDASRRFILVTRRSRLDDLVDRHNTVGQARFQMEQRGGDFDDLVDEHRVYTAAVAAVQATLGAAGRVQRIDRGLLPTFLFPPDAQVVVVGQDGLVANTLKYLDGQSVVAINPDPARIDGVLLPFLTNDLDSLLPDWGTPRLHARQITLAEVRLDDGQHLLAVNDLFIGPRSHTSARYALSVGDRTEVQSSSGIIVSTGLGSTGWLRSLNAGAQAIVGARREDNTPADSGFAWDARQLCFTVREPFPSRTTGIDLVQGWIDEATPLRIASQMTGHGVIFSDGIEADFLEFNAGMQAEIGIAARQGHLVIGGRHG